MDEQTTQPRVERAEQDLPIDERQPWQQPRLERLHVSLDTANSKGSGSDGIFAATPPP